MIVGSRTACPGKSSVDDFRAKDDHVANPKSAKFLKQKTGQSANQMNCWKSQLGISCTRTSLNHVTCSSDSKIHLVDPRI